MSFAPDETALADLGNQTATMLRTHADLVARFGLGAAPTFKQELNRVVARLDAAADAESDRPVEGVTGPRQSGL